MTTPAHPSTLYRPDTDPLPESATPLTNSSRADGDLTVRSGRVAGPAELPAGRTRVVGVAIRPDSVAVAWLVVAPRPARRHQREHHLDHQLTWTVIEHNDRYTQARAILAREVERCWLYAGTFAAADLLHQLEPYRGDRVLDDLAGLWPHRRGGLPETMDMLDVAFDVADGDTRLDNALHRHRPLVTGPFSDSVIEAASLAAIAAEHLKLTDTASTSRVLAELRDHARSVNLAHPRP
ncbi:hypothetical protein ACIGO9_30445 [Nocardia asteroides]|uniref:hypothetical protein n=1 Tax=Nocardia asteroides TaxID=1824 RepID=UPI0037C65319